MRSLRRAAVVALAVAVALPACGPVPSGAKRKSQPALLVQQAGATRLTVRYNRPSARGRALFGGIVPWDSVWCPGADEATRLETTRDLAVAGRALPKGAYSLWVIPRASADWTLIFSRKARVEHVPYPGAEHDALRIAVRPVRGPHTESLAYTFPLATPDSAVLHFAWGDVTFAVPLKPRTAAAPAP
ncbi:MAG TPA: DUF2911 domain-containing protein [Longimicrobium sp.]|nr:DUF2911 domain-containing protein [Longimicrobium sp.]